MAEVFGNVNVKYNPCKSIAQLKSTADYILGKRKEQIAEGIEKTRPELYNAFGCNRDNFANSLIMTRKMHQKKYSRYKPKEILAQKLSISFHPDDNDKLTYEEAYKMAEQFAREGEGKICVSEAFLEQAGKGDYVFVEDRPLAPWAEKVEKLVVFRWNRVYPGDQYFDLDLAEGQWHKTETRDFPGKSHERITMEVYTR